MSMELHAFTASVPDLGRWQTALEALGTPIVLAFDAEALKVGGFCPMRLDGQASGVEIDVGDASERQDEEIVEAPGKLIDVMRECLTLSFGAAKT